MHKKEEIMLLSILFCIVCLGFINIVLAGYLAKKATITLRVNLDDFTSHKHQLNSAYQKIMSAVILGFFGLYFSIAGTLVILYIKLK